MPCGFRPLPVATALGAKGLRERSRSRLFSTEGRHGRNAKSGPREIGCVHDDEVLSLDALQCSQLIVVPFVVRRTRDEPVGPVVRHDHSVALESSKNDPRLPSEPRHVEAILGASEDASADDRRVDSSDCRAERAHSWERRPAGLAGAEVIPAATTAATRAVAHLNVFTTFYRPLCAPSLGLLGMPGRRWVEQSCLGNRPLLLGRLT